MTEQEIHDAMDQAYRMAGDNAYFGNGFNAGVSYAVKQLEPKWIDVSVPLKEGTDEVITLDEEGHVGSMGTFRWLDQVKRQGFIKYQYLPEPPKE